MHRAAMIESHPVAWCYELKVRTEDGEPRLEPVDDSVNPRNQLTFDFKEEWRKQIGFENPHGRFPEGRVRNVHPLFAVVQYDSALPMGGTGECPF